MSSSNVYYLQVRESLQTLPNFTFQENIQNENLIKNLLSDKIFQYYFYKYFQSDDYEQFVAFADSDKVSFLTSLFLYVSKVDNLKQYENKLKLDYKHNLSLAPKDIINSLNSLQNIVRKQEILEKMNTLNLTEINNENLKFKSENKIQEMNIKLKELIQNYSEPVEVNTNPEEFDNIVNNLQNLISIYNESSEIKGNILENYIKEENLVNANNNSISKHLLHELNYDTENSYKEPVKTVVSLLNKNITNNFFKVDYLKRQFYQMGKINTLKTDFYHIDNREVHMTTSKNQFTEVFKSENNNIKDMITFNDDFNYKICDKSKRNKYYLNNPKTHIKFKIRHYQKENSNLFSIIKKQNIKKSKEIVIINEPISQLNEISLFDTSKKKCYTGKDIIDRIYFCPANSIVVLDYNETNKLGILLLDYLRLEANQGNYKEEYDKNLKELNQKFQEEVRRVNEEKERSLSELNNIKQLYDRQLELIYEYQKALKNKIEYCQKLFNEDLEFNHMDNSKVIATINKNLDVLTKSTDEEILNMNLHNMNLKHDESQMVNIQLAHDNSMDSTGNAGSSIKDFYVKKKVYNVNAHGVVMNLSHS